MHSIIANNLGNTVKVHVFEIFNYIDVINLPSKSFQIDITKHSVSLNNFFYSPTNPYKKRYVRKVLANFSKYTNDVVAP